MEKRPEKRFPRGSRFLNNMAAVLICAGFGAIAFFSVSGFNFRNLKYSGDSITSDEVPHITSGYYYLKTGRYFLNPEHPPLVKDISALPIRLFLNPDFPEVSAEAAYPSEAEKEDLFLNKKIFPRVLEIENYHWDNRMLIFNQKNNPDLIILLARLSVIIFNSAILFVFYLAMTKNYDRKTALAGLFVAAVSPLSLAHGSLVTTDFTSSVLQISALGFFALYLKNFSIQKKSFWWLLASALLFFLAFSAKFSSLALMAPAFLGGFIYIILRKRNLPFLLKYLAQCSTLAAISLALVISFYAWHTRDSDSAGITFQIQNNYPAKFPESGKNLMIKMSEGNSFGRAVATYGIGLSMVVNRIDSAGQSAYFMGKVYGSEGAGVWYFPALYFYKIPLPFHLLSLACSILFLLSVFFIFVKKTDDSKIKNILFFLKNIQPFSLLLAIFIAFFSYKALSSNLNIGIRHFMPVILAAIALTAAGVGRYWQIGFGKIFTFKNFFLVSLTLIAASSTLSFPHYLSYYNVAAGGTDNGYQIATDSNYDWGQDVKRLGKWVNDNNIKTIYLDIFSLNAPNYYMGNAFRYFNIKNDELPPPGSHIAVSAMNYQNNVYDENIPDNKKYSSLKNNLVARVGKTIFIFKIP